MKLSYWIAVACALPPMATAQTQPAEKAFGARESVTSASLSPGGTRFAFLAPTSGQGNALYTAPVDGSTPPRRAVMASGDPERLSGCGWVSETRLTCLVHSPQTVIGRAVASGRIIAVDHDGANLKLISRRAAPDALYVSGYGGSVIDWQVGQDNAILIDSWFVPEVRAGSLIEQRAEGLGIERIDTATGGRKTVLRPMLGANDFVTDGLGTPRIAAITETTGDFTATGRHRLLFRAKGSADWQTLGIFNRTTDTGFNALAVDPDKDIAYGFLKQNGRQALVARTLDGSGRDTTLLARPDVDVDGLIRLGRRGRAIGATYATDRRVGVYFDPLFVDLQAKLAKAIPGAALVNFEGASDDENRILLWAGSDVDPGRYYLFDRKAKQLRPLILSRPELDGVKLAPVTSVTVRASDGTGIPGYLTLPPGSNGKGLPAIVMPHGGPSARDEWGFDWLAQYFAHQGYAVLQPNFRGSSGYGDGWFQNNGFRSWRVAVGDVVDSGRWLVSQGIADPKTLGIVGWSYGGYAALQSGVIAPDVFKAIVAIAPVTDLDDLRQQYGNTSYHRVARDFIGTGRHIEEGSPARHADRIAAPVLLFHGTLDQNVRYNASQLMEAALRRAGKPYQLVTYEKLTHQLDDATARADMLKRSDAFLKAAFAK